MAKDTIRGISVTIGADTSLFLKEMKKVDKAISSTQKVANELQKGLELKFDSNRFVQAQNIVKNSLEDTEKKAEAIRKELKFLEDSGNIDTDGYRRLETELARTENEALKLKEQLKEIDKIKVDSATKGIQELSKNLETAAKKTAVLSGAATAAIAGIVKLGKDAVKTGDDIQTTADQYSLSAEAIQRWNYIALQTDVATDALYKGMTKVRDAFGTAMVGETNAATEAMQKLGVSFENIDDEEQAFENVIIALSGVQDSTMQAYYANEIFGEGIATTLLPLLKQGQQAINQYSKEFEAVGYLSDAQVRQLADFDNELNKVNQQFQNAKTELGMALLPVLQTFADILTEYIVPAIKNLAQWFNNLSPAMQKIVSGGLLLAAALAPVLLILSKITGAIPTLVKLFTSLKNMTLKTAAGFAALSRAIGLVFDLIGNWGQMSALEKVLKTIALAALTAAAAITIFHASWSLGIAVGAIAAAVVAGIAAINSAAKDIGIETNFSDESSVAASARSYQIPSYNGSSANTYNEDNSQYNINVNLNATGDLNYDARSLADEVIKQIAIKKQASGR